VKNVENMGDTGIHDVRWNAMTKEYDDEERAKPPPPGTPSKKQSALYEAYYSVDATRLRQKQGNIIDMETAVPKGSWGDAVKPDAKPDAKPDTKPDTAKSRPRRESKRWGSVGS
jgi:hypothetical protein